MRILFGILINAAAFWVAAWLVPGIQIGPAPGTSGESTALATVVTYLAIGAIFGLVNLVLGSLLRFLTAPLRCLTLGLFALIVNAALLEATAWVTSFFPLHFTVDTFFWDAILGAIIVSIVSAVLGWFLPARFTSDR